MEDSIKVFIRARPSSSSNGSTSIALDEESRTVYITNGGTLNNNSATMNKFQYSGVLGLDLCNHTNIMACIQYASKQLL